MQPVSYVSARPPAVHEVVVKPTQVLGARDLVRWGPILAGLLMAIGLFVLLSVLLLAVGAQAIRVGSTTTSQVVDVGGVATAAVGLLCFFIGGWVAGSTASVGGRLYGALDGFLVWSLGLIVILVLTGLGVGGVLGAAGGLLFAQYRAAGTAGAGTTDAIVQSIRDASWPAFLTLALPAVAAVIGGYLGSRETAVVEVVPSAVVEDAHQATA